MFHALQEYWQSVPPITRALFLISFCLSVAVTLELVSPLRLYFNWRLISEQHQYWRLLTSLFYIGSLSPHTLLTVYIDIRYSYNLETGAFRNRPADFIMFFIFGYLNFLLAAYFFGLEFMADCVSHMVLYLWARKIPNIDLNFFDVFVFRSCFLPYFYITITALCGYTPINQIIGCAVGHLYFFLDDVVPRIKETQDCRVIKAPEVLQTLCHWLNLH